MICISYYGYDKSHPHLVLQKKGCQPKVSILIKYLIINPLLHLFKIHVLDIGLIVIIGTTLWPL